MFWFDANLYRIIVRSISQLSMKNIKLIFVLTLFSMAAAHSQEIRTKVNESTFDLKPDAVKQEELDEATTFVYGGIGYGRRIGELRTGFSAYVQTSNISLRTAEDNSPFQDGAVFDLGFRHFFDNRIGVGLHTGLFYNNTSFIPANLVDKDASQTSSIYQGTLEVLYRHYLSSDKTMFLYGGLGFGWSYLNQSQRYRYTKTEYEAGFFNFRPVVGIDVPVWDVVHLYAETAYSFSQGKVTEGNLSLSQFQISAGVQIRLNSF